MPDKQAKCSCLPMIYHKKLICCEFLSKQMSYVESIHLYGSENVANKLFHMGHPDSLVTKELLMLKNKQTVKSWSLVFGLLIYLQRVCFSPSSQVSHLLQQNEVSKYISVSCTLSLFFASLALYCHIYL